MKSLQFRDLAIGDVFQLDVLGPAKLVKVTLAYYSLLDPLEAARTGLNSIRIGDTGTWVTRPETHVPCGRR